MLNMLVMLLYDVGYDNVNKSDDDDDDDDDDGDTSSILVWNC